MEEGEYGRRFRKGGGAREGGLRFRDCDYLDFLGAFLFVRILKIHGNYVLVYWLQKGVAAC